MDALRKQASKLREQVAKQQQVNLWEPISPFSYRVMDFMNWVAEVQVISVVPSSQLFDFLILCLFPEFFFILE